jgi:Mn-dependent DtxR family transcriptional regulator
VIDRDRDLLLVIYGAWSRQKISVLNEAELSELAAHLGFDAQVSEIVTRLVDAGYLARTQSSIYLTSKGMEEGFRVEIGGRQSNVN